MLEDRPTGTSGGQTSVLHMYCPLINRMQVACSLEFLNTYDDIQIVSKTFICYWMTYFLLTNTARHLLDVWFITSTVLTTQNTAEKYIYNLTRTKHDCTLTQWIFNWNTSVTGHKHRTVGFPESSDSQPGVRVPPGVRTRTFRVTQKN